MKKVAVLMGGLSKEREVSLRSGKAVAGALRKKGHDVTEIDADARVIDKLKTAKPEAAFIALHGKFGEDGTIQGILEWLRIPYTSPSVSTSALCHDKVWTKSVLRSLSLRLSPEMVFRRHDDVDLWLKKFDMAPLEFPVIVKPSCEGSSIGIRRVYKRGDLKGALREGIVSDEVLLVEELIEGREITVGILNGKALPIVEVRPKSGFYDFKSKYTPGQTEYLVPAPLDDLFREELQASCEHIYSFLKLEGAVRMDFMLNEKGESYFLEVNTIPGMTETSLLPKAAACAGLSFEDLCEEILKDARLKIAL